MIWQSELFETNDYLELDLDLEIRLLCDLLLYIHANYKKDLGIHTLSKVYATSIILISSSNATSGETIRSTPFDETNWTTFISRDQIAKGVTAEKHVINLLVLAKETFYLLLGFYVASTVFQTFCDAWLIIDGGRPQTPDCPLRLN